MQHPAPTTPHPPILSSDNNNNNNISVGNGSCNRLEATTSQLVRDDASSRACRGLCELSSVTVRGIKPYGLEGLHWADVVEAHVTEQLESHNTNRDYNPHSNNMRKHLLKPRRSPTATLGCNFIFQQEEEAAAAAAYVDVSRRNENDGAISMMPEEQWYTPYIHSSGNVTEPPCIFQRRRNRIEAFASVSRPSLRRGEEMVEEDVSFGICSPPPRPTSRSRKEAIMVPSLRYDGGEGHCDEEEEEFVDLRIMGDVLSNYPIENGLSRIGLECDGFSRDIFSPTPKRQSHHQTRMLVQKEYEEEDESMKLRRSSSSAFGRHIPLAPH